MKLWSMSEKRENGIELLLYKFSSVHSVLLPSEAHYFRTYELRKVTEGLRMAYEL